MNRRMILYVLCIIMRLEAIVMVPALLIGVARQELGAVGGFFLAIVLLLGVSSLTDAFPAKKESFSAREGFIIVAITWLVASAFGALPFFVSGEIPNFADSFLRRFPVLPPPAPAS